MRDGLRANSGPHPTTDRPECRVLRAGHTHLRECEISAGEARGPPRSHGCQAGSEASAERRALGGIRR